MPEDSLLARIRQSAQPTGRVTFAEYMALALYDPDFGFYGSGRASIGRRGDFITSVSVGPLFGRLLARQWAEMWERLGSPAQCTLIEEGAHEGRLAADLLAALETQAPACAAATRYLIVEPGAVWRQRQEAMLAGLRQVRWAQSWDEVEPTEGAHFSNELLDAFPVHLVEWQGGWQECYVAIDEAGSLRWELGPPSSSALQARLDLLPGPWPTGFRTEINVAQEAWLERVSAHLQRGWVLVVDYGYERAEYYRPERSEGTLSAYRQQQRVKDPLSSPGEIDLTAHIDFTALEEHARTLGWQVAGLTDQQRFLVRLSQLHFQDSATISPAQMQEHRQFRTLMHPELMGAAFKVIGFSRGVEDLAPLTGFKPVQNS